MHSLILTLGGLGELRQLCKPSTSSRLCITVSNSPNPSRVYIRLCKQGKRFLLLKYKPDAIYCSHNLSPRAISVETKFQSRSRRKHHHTNTCFSSRQREETNKRLHEVDDLSEVPSPNTSRIIDKDNKIHTRSAN